ncbi:MAG: CAP domain-containing protein [Candidatus Binatia bacterium]
MPLPGWGRRTAATLLVTIALACAGASSASDRDEARPESSSSVSRPGQPNAPSTKSLPRATITPGSRTKLSTYPSVSGVTEPNPDEKLLVELINVERTSRGLKPVVWDGLLSGLARMHGADMRAVRKASHNSAADGANFGTRLSRTPYRASAAAENVAYNANVVKAHRALMESPGHRKNILDPVLTAVGTAVLTDTKDDWVWVVEDFATPIAHVSDTEAERIMRDTLAKRRSRWSSLPEDKALSRKLDVMVEEMIQHGAVRSTGSVGPGWTLAFTSLDPTEPPASAIERAAKAEGYALAVSFRKTPRYPFGAYWAILFLKGEY